VNVAIDYNQYPLQGVAVVLYITISRCVFCIGHWMHIFNLCNNATENRTCRQTVSLYMQYFTGRKFKDAEN